MSSFLLVNHTGFKVYTDCDLLNPGPVTPTFQTHPTLIEFMQAQIYLEEDSLKNLQNPPALYWEDIENKNNKLSENKQKSKNKKSPANLYYH